MAPLLLSKLTIQPQQLREVDLGVGYFLADDGKGGLMAALAGELRGDGGWGRLGSFLTIVSYGKGLG